MIDTLTAHWVGTEVRYKLVDAPLPVNQLWRVKHDTYPFTRLNLPEVHPLLLNHFSEFGRSWQLLERALNSHLTDAKWRALHGYKRAFNNGNNGYGGPGEPLADWVNGYNLGASNPKQEALVCGGAILAGYVDGQNLVVETLDASGPVPRLEDLKPWQWFTAVNIDEDTQHNGVIRRFLNGEEAFILLLADRRRYPKVTIPLAKVTKLDMTKPLPSAYQWP